jgi:PTS system glucitol/sorbitol-specific IIA component
MSKYSVTITSIGQCAQEALDDDMLILFNQSATEDIADYCFVHGHDELKSEIEVGDTLVINETEYPVTAVGLVASKNLKNLGHITLRFDGSSDADTTGSVHLKGEQPTSLEVGSTFNFK